MNAFEDSDVGTEPDVITNDHVRIIFRRLLRICDRSEPSPWDTLMVAGDDGESGTGHDLFAYFDLCQGSIETGACPDI